jgi:hypothetical protein
VSALPLNDALVNIWGAAQAGQAALASKNTPQGIAYHKAAFALAMAPFEKPRTEYSAVAHDKETGMSISIVSQFQIGPYRTVWRADILYGWAAPIPEWICRIAS